VSNLPERSIRPDCHGGYLDLLRRVGSCAGGRLRRAAEWGDFHLYRGGRWSAEFESALSPEFAGPLQPWEPLRRCDVNRLWLCYLGNGFGDVAHGFGESGSRCRRNGDQVCAVARTGRIVRLL